MSLTDFLFEGKAPPAVDTAQLSNTQLPPFAQQYMQGLMGRANVIAGQEYTPFPGARVAAPTANQSTAWNTIAANTGNTAPMFQSGASNISASATPFDQATFNQFKSPYIDDVVNRIATLGTRNFNENLLPSLNDKFIGSGQFRSDRNAEMVARLTRDTNESIMGQQAMALQQAQDSAMNQYQQGMNRQQQAGVNMGNLAAMQAGTQIKDAAALEAAGQAQRGINQENLNVGYQNFLDQRDWGKNQIRFMNEAIRGLQPVGSTTTGTQQQLAPAVSASPLAQIAGGIGAISALTGRAKGGRIVKKAPLKELRRYG
jgi:hypothetical protein